MKISTTSLTNETSYLDWSSTNKCWFLLLLSTFELFQGCCLGLAKSGLYKKIWYQDHSTNYHHNKFADSQVIKLLLNDTNTHFKTVIKFVVIHKKM
jgi:hypothetical protein